MKLTLRSLKWIWIQYSEEHAVVNCVHGYAIDTAASSCFVHRTHNILSLPSGIIGKICKYYDLGNQLENNNNGVSNKLSGIKIQSLQSLLQIKVSSECRSIKKWGIIYLQVRHMYLNGFSDWCGTDNVEAMPIKFYQVLHYTLRQLS